MISGFPSHGYTRPPHYDDSGQSCVSLTRATLQDLSEPVYCTDRGPFDPRWEGNRWIISHRIKLHDLDPQAQHVAYAYEQKLWGIRHTLERVMNQIDSGVSLPGVDGVISRHSQLDIKNILYGLADKERCW